LLVAGPVVQQLSRSFDEYWNSDWAVPVSAFGLAPPGRDEAERLADAVAAQATDARDTEYGERLASSNFASMLKTGTLPMIWAAAHAVYDKPAKIKVHEGDDPVTHIGPHLRDIREAAQTELMLISPYFIPSEAGRKLLGELSGRGVRVRVLTNSLASTDVPVVHSGYARYRTELLRKGVDLYELRPVQGATAPHSTRLFARSSESSLHAKAFIVDRGTAFVGSMNLDPRSRHLNTELGVIVESPALSSKLAEIFDEAFQPTMHFEYRSRILSRQMEHSSGLPRRTDVKYSTTMSPSPVFGNACGPLCCLF
jgi:putative cardiolipin synthase